MKLGGLAPEFWLTTSASYCRKLSTSSFTASLTLSFSCWLGSGTFRCSKLYYLLRLACLLGLPEPHIIDTCMLHSFSLLLKALEVQSQASGLSHSLQLTLISVSSASSWSVSDFCSPCVVHLSHCSRYQKWYQEGDVIIGVLRKVLPKGFWLAYQSVSDMWI